MTKKKTENQDKIEGVDYSEKEAPTLKVRANYKRLNKAVLEFPNFKPMYEKLKTEEIIDCNELRATLTELHLNRESEKDKLKYGLLDVLFSFFLRCFEKRCPIMARQFQTRLIPNCKKEFDSIDWDALQKLGRKS